MIDVFAVAEVLSTHALENYPDEIDLIGYYGSHARGDARRKNRPRTLGAAHGSLVYSRENQGHSARGVHGYEYRGDIAGSRFRLPCGEG